jgi:esterase/lipase superfamily enzyme
MSLTLDRNPSLVQLLQDLEHAVRQNDSERSRELEHIILQRLCTIAAELDSMEQQVRALMLQLRDVTAGEPAPPAEEEEEEPGDVSWDTPLSPRSSKGGQGKGAMYPVWFATNRQPDGKGGFTSQRGERISRGHAQVFIPDAHKFGEIGSNFFTKLKRLDFRHDTISVEEILLEDDGSFYAVIRQDLRQAHATSLADDALIFIHGFNVGFEDAAIRTAQIGVDLNIAEGAAGFFSWPSKGTVKGYPADEASMEASERLMADFLVEFCENIPATRNARKIHLIAHSMGNRGLLRALQRIVADVHTRGKVTFGQIFLAAPDLDRDLFLDLAHLYPMHAKRTTLYASDKDLPVHLSAKLHDAPRAGTFLPYTTAPEVDTICVPNFDVDLLGHGYFATAEALLYDMNKLIVDNPPLPRFRIDRLKDGKTEDENITVWHFLA